MVVKLAALFLVLLIAGCSGIPQDGRYQTHDAGRSNNRAEMPGSSATLFS
jgi:hypothetical protein